MRKFNTAFSLVEILVAVVIVSILSAVGYNYYAQQRIESQRAAATSAILKLYAEIEHFMATENNFSDSVFTVPYNTNLNFLEYMQITRTTTDGNYTYIANSVPGVSTTLYHIRATVVPGSFQASDPNCQVIEFTRYSDTTIGRSGGPTESALVVNQCWD